ncbi:MAG TPA: hypothetical protein VFT43_11955 [Candidatus Polarisedimenticolia bacterium]|nr:hypothetical protein [Candidatus Polarisedimenticolia bacterium]
MMSHARPVLLLLLLAALVLPACSRKPEKLLADDAERKAIIESLATNPTMRQEVIDRLIGSPVTRLSVVERVLKDDGAAGDLVKKIMSDNHGRALVAAKVAEDSDAKTFIRMLMLTGVMGDSMTQKQANAIGLGEPFAFGNQRRTMIDLRRIGRMVEASAKEAGGHYPVCLDFEDGGACLSKKLGGKGTEVVGMKDAWGHPFQYRSDREGTQYVLVSYSTDGAYDGLGKVGPTDSFDCDIVFSNGDFIQWPGWIQKTDIR